MPARSTTRVIQTPILLLAIAEAVILYSSVYVAGLVVCSVNLELCEQVLGQLVPKGANVTLIMILSFLSMGLYQFHRRVYFRETIARVVVGFLVGSVALAVTFYFYPFLNVSPQIWLIAVIYSFIAFLGLRYFFFRTVDENIFRRNVLVLGAGDRAASIYDLRRRADRRGFRLLGIVPVDGDPSFLKTTDLIDKNRTLLDIAIGCDADEIVIALDDRRGNLPIKELLKCKLHGVAILDLLEFLERESGKIRVDLVNPDWLIFSPGFKVTKIRRIVKRFVDILVGMTVLLLTWPILILVTLAIKLEDGFRQPVFYRQLRVGYNGEHFKIFKFRSMKIDAESDGQAVWASLNDSRVTRIGRLIRKARIDELPQIFNILRGQMSVVGPRPERPSFVAMLSESIPYYDERHTVKPGVTGWAQLNYSYGSSIKDAIEKLQYDLYYVKNQNLILDLAIMIQTVEVILWGKGAR